MSTTQNYIEVFHPMQEDAYVRWKEKQIGDDSLKSHQCSNIDKHKFLNHITKEKLNVS